MRDDNRSKSVQTHKVGVPQGTLLGSTSLLLHLNNLKTIYDDEKYVGDTISWESCNRSGSNSSMQTATNQAVKRTKKNYMELNTDKTKEMNI